MKYIYTAFVVAGIFYAFGHIGAQEVDTMKRNQCLDSHSVSEWEKCEL